MRLCESSRPRSAASRGAEAADLLRHAAALVVDEACSFGVAKRQAATRVGWRGPLPGDAALDDAVREHLSLFGPVSQPQDCAALRALALRWMDRLAAFDPHLTGAVWWGVATRAHPVVLQLRGADPKALLWALMDWGVPHHAEPVAAGRGQPTEVWAVEVPGGPAGGLVTLVLQVFDESVWRQLPRLDERGRARRGDRLALAELVRGGDHGA